MGYRMTAQEELVSQANARLSISEIKRYAPGAEVEGDICYVPGDLDCSVEEYQRNRIEWKTGRWSDAVDWAAGGDFASWVAQLLRCSIVEAARDILKNCPPPAAEPGEGGVEWEPLASVPADAPEIGFWLNGLGTPTKTYRYQNLEGRTSCYETTYVRDGVKETRNWCCAERNGFLAWRPLGLPSPRPPYGLQGLTSNPCAPVLIVPNVEQFDAAEIFILCVGCDFVPLTWAGGSAGVPETDWTPLRGREVIIWSDRGARGLEARRALALILQGLGCAVRTFPPASGAFAGANLLEATRYLDPEGAKDLAVALKEAALLDRGLAEEVVSPDEGLDETSPVRRRPWRGDLAEVALDQDLRLGANGLDVLAKIPCDDHVETADVRSLSFRLWLRLVGKQAGLRPRPDEIEGAATTIYNLGLAEGRPVAFSVRVSVKKQVDDFSPVEVIVDTGWDDWGMVRITPFSWGLIDSRDPDTPWFLRPAGFGSLPRFKKRQGDLCGLAHFLKDAGYEDGGLSLAWENGKVTEGVPYGVLAFICSQGTDEIYTPLAVKALVDPDGAPDSMLVEGGGLSTISILSDPEPAHDRNEVDAAAPIAR